MSAELALRDPTAGPPPIRPSPRASWAAGPSRIASHARVSRLGLRTVALGYLLLLLVLPVGMVFWRTFEHGLAPVWAAVTAPDAVHAFWLSLLLVAIAVPLNTVFGVAAAIAVVRQRFWGRRVMSSLIDVPFAISPVVVGLALVLAYGHNGWFGNWLDSVGIQVIFSVPGMVMATVFVSLPFVAREVIPVLREVGTEAEEAATTLGASPARTFWHVTLPAIRWGIVYGVVLTSARALGEFGAVSVVSGRLSGSTQSLPLYVQDRFENFDATGAYTAAVVLAVLAILILVVMNVLARNRRVVA